MKRSDGVIEIDVYFRDFTELHLIQEVLQIVPQHRVVNLFELTLLSIGERGAKESGVDHLKKGILMLPIFRKVLLERTRDI